MSVYPVLRALERAMEREPYMRLGQLLINVVPLGRDPFYVENDELIAYLDNFRKDEDAEQAH